VNGTRGRTEQDARLSVTRKTNAYQSERCLAHAILQPPYIRENSPRMLPHSPLGLSRSLSTDPPLSFHPSQFGYTSLEDRGACHLSPAGKKCASLPVPNSADFVRRLSTISPLFVRRQEEAAAPISRRNENSVSFWFLRPLWLLFRLKSMVSKEQQSKKLIEQFLFYKICKRYV